MGKSGRLRDERVRRVEHVLERLLRDDVLRARVAGRRFTHGPGRVDQNRHRGAQAFLDFGLIRGRLVGSVAGRRRICGPPGRMPLTRQHPRDQEGGQHDTHRTRSHEGDGCRAQSIKSTADASALRNATDRAQLVEPVHAVLDRDPSIEADLGQQPEDRVVVVETLPRFPMPQRGRVTSRAIGRLAGPPASIPAPETGPTRAS